MGRELRIEFEHAFYHVMSRGNTRSRIFRDDDDRLKFLEYLRQSHEKYGAIIHSYCLMNNHYHLLVETPNANLTCLMQTLNTAYTNYYNKCHNRVGHLFSGRYKGLLIDKDNYLLNVSAYIHLNPVKAGICNGPLEYRWSSLKYFNDLRLDKPEYIETDVILKYFRLDKNVTFNNYIEFINCDSTKKIDIEKNVFEKAIIGKGDFIENIRKRAILEGWPVKNTLLFKKLYSNKKFLDKIESEVSKRNELSEKEKRNVKIYLLRKWTPLKLSEISRKIQGLSLSGIIKIYKTIDKKLKSDLGFRRIVSSVEMEIL